MFYSGGRKSTSFDKELEILEWFKNNRKHVITVTLRALVGYAISIIKEFENKSLKLWHFRDIKLWKEII